MTDMETVTFRVPYGRDNNKNAYGDYSHLQLVYSRPKGSAVGTTGDRQWSLVASPVWPHGDLLLTEEEGVSYLHNFFLQQAAFEKQPKQPDLLTTLAAHRWRLDCRKDTGEYRVMYWCESCGLWRCVEDSGAYHASPHEAIAAAIKAESEETP